MASPMRDSHLYSVYFAPRGKARMINLGWMLSQRHLSPFDLLIGFIGEPGFRQKQPGAGDVPRPGTGQR